MSIPIETKIFELETKEYTYEFLKELAEHEGVPLNDLIIGILNYYLNTKYPIDYFNFRNSFSERK